MLDVEEQEAAGGDVDEDRRERVDSEGGGAAASRRDLKNLTVVQGRLAPRLWIASQEASFSISEASETSLRGSQSSLRLKEFLFAEQTTESHRNDDVQARASIHLSSNRLALFAERPASLRLLCFPRAQSLAVSFPFLFFHTRQEAECAEALLLQRQVIQGEAKGKGQQRKQESLPRPSRRTPKLGLLSLRHIVPRWGRNTRARYLSARDDSESAFETRPLLLSSTWTPLETLGDAPPASSFHFENEDGDFAAVPADDASPSSPSNKRRLAEGDSYSAAKGCGRRATLVISLRLDDGELESAVRGL